VVAALFLASRAYAEPSPLDKASAQALFDDALKLMASKSFALACPKLEESQRLDPAMGTEYRLAECYEAVGRTASAWAGFAEVADLARASGQKDREKTARGRAARLEPTLCRASITAAAPDTPGLEVRRGDVLVGKGQWGTAVPIDPGTYPLAATAPGKKPWAGSLVVAGDGCRAVSVVVPPLEDAPAAVVSVPPPTPPAPPAPLPASPSPPASEPAPSSVRKVLGIATLATGVVGVGAGIGIGFAAKRQYDGAGSHCQGTLCDASGKQTTDSARTLGDVGTGVFVAGAVLAAGGIVLWITAPSASAADKASVGFSVGPGAALVSGVF
jgi:serine/threonine-protein kinase